jgi:hypothetical protein
MLLVAGTDLKWNVKPLTAGIILLLTLGTAWLGYLICKMDNASLYKTDRVITIIVAVICISATISGNRELEHVMGGYLTILMVALARTSRMVYYMIELSKNPGRGENI